ncbi:MAG TPA: DNA internalization-related competence protein ComEC/Rec2 [Gemmatimonadaceae bacterium]|nr:DNA internalization-related competence protein ComEC/Rec2 [Gemmatimonadaceae bacterium]
MPLIAAAALVYAAALFIGLGGAAFPGAAAAALAAAGAGMRRDAALAGLALLALAGCVVGARARADDRRCAGQTGEEATWQVRLLADARPGDRVPVERVAGGCRGRNWVGVRSGAGQAGAVVRARGVLARGRRTAGLEGARVDALGPPSGAAALRARAGHAIDRAFGADAPLARALLIADERAIAPELRRRFADAGIVHMLSISGLHVGVIATAVTLALRGLRVPPAAADLATVVITAGYVALIGAPAAAVRAGAMLGVAAACRLAQRPTSPWAALAVGGLFPLADGRTVLDLGWQLSVTGMAALIGSAALVRRWLPHAAGWRRALAGAFLTSAFASVITAPLVAWHFGRVSIIAPVTNLAAAPVMTAVQPLLFLALLAAPAPRVAAFLADAAHPALALFVAVADVAATVPHAALEVAPGPVSAVAAGTASAALVVAAVSRFPGRPLVVATAAWAVALWAPLAPARRGDVELHVLDVGQGDAIALRTDRGRWVLFDAGRSGPGGGGARVVLPYVQRRGGAVVAFVLSHPHADHAGGAAAVLRAMRPAEYWDAAFAGSSTPYRESLAAARAGRLAWRRVHPGDSLRVDGVTVRFLAPDSTWTAALTDPNLASTVARVEYGAVRFLLVGDAEAAEEDWLLRRWPAVDLTADVLKVGHHGSATSTTSAFLRAVRPRLALISVGAGNRYGHPSPGVLRRLAGTGAAVARTDRLGTVVVRTDGRAIRVEADGDEWELSPRPFAP